MVRRLLTPLGGAEIQKALSRSGQGLIEQSLNLADERFVVYVPAHAGPHGHALLVFVPPWDEAAVPKGWATVLEREDVIFVSAARSGNEANNLGRREPLALIAALNLVQRYPVDPERIYIGGFSGGSRIALRLALAYPDIFRGALLNAGSDPIGTDAAAPPPPDLFQRFQDSTQLVYLTGAADRLHLDMDAVSEQSLRKWCVSNIDAMITPGAGHEPAAPAALSRALEVLLNHAPRPDGKAAACKASLQNELNEQLAKAQSLVSAGHNDEAQKLLLKIDEHFGALAAPHTAELAQKCNCIHP
jgi:predicted esterase